MIKKILFTTLFIIFCASILALSLRGIQGNPTSETINQPQWRDEGPLELSPDRGKFALTYSLVEDKSFSFSLPVARFATPDLGFVDGKYVSLFAPGVSFITIPGYLLGKSLGVAQVGTFAVISLFAILNILLLRAIAVKIGANPTAATIASLIFIFATPAFSYAVTLYQHHISIFLILLSLYLLIRFQGIGPLFAIWFLAAAAVTVDYPNLFLMFPIGIFALGRFIILKKEQGKLNVNLKLAGVLTFATALLPILFLLWFNFASFGNPFQLSGTVPSVKAIDEQGNPTAPALAGTENIQKFIQPETQEKAAVRFFKTRNLLAGFNTHLASLDRGIVGFTPVVLFGILGGFLLYRKNQSTLNLLASILGINILLYSMWGDPYGGWAFGSRYLIPSYAILSIFLALALTNLRKNSLFLLIFFIITSYSIAVNTLGAITTSANPPKVEAVPLSQITGIPEKYTYERNFDFLVNYGSKSFIFQSFASKYLAAWQYYLAICLPIISVSAFLLLILRFFVKEQRHEKI